MLDKAPAHVLGQVPPAVNKRIRVGAVLLAQFVVQDGWKYASQLRKAAGPGQLRNGTAKLAPRRVARGQLAELLFELDDVDGHLPLTSVARPSDFPAENTGA